MAGDNDFMIRVIKFKIPNEDDQGDTVAEEELCNLTTEVVAEDLSTTVSSVLDALCTKLGKVKGERAGDIKGIRIGKGKKMLDVGKSLADCKLEKGATISLVFSEGEGVEE